MPTTSRKEKAVSKYNVYVEDVSVEAVFNKLGGVEGARRLLRDEMEIVMKKVVATVVSLLTLVKTVVVSAVLAKKTSDCFTNMSRYYYRDSNLGAWLPGNQHEQPESKFSVQKLSQSATFKQAVESFLGITGDIATLAKILKERGAVTTLPTIELLIARQEAGEDVGLRTDGRANLFFMEDGNGSVSVVGVRRIVSRWCVYVYRLGFDGDVWYAEYRFFFRNQPL